MEGISGTAPMTLQEPAPTTAEAAPETPLASESGSAQAITKEGEGKTSPKEATSPESAQERFLTLDDVPEEHRPYVEALLKDREKQMMAAYTKKTQAIAQDRQKIDAYNAFERDPINTIQRIATQLGYDVSPRNSQQTAQQPVDAVNWEPQTWDEVLARAEERTTQNIINTLKPLLAPLYQNLEEVKSQSIEHQLGQIDENWRIYEDDIKANMNYIKPDLLKTAEGIKKLYRMSVPEEVFSSRATQAALKQFEAKAKNAQIEGKSKVQKTAPNVGKINNFNDAVLAAKRLHNLI
jgi:hypothetical protein